MKKKLKFWPTILLAITFINAAESVSPGYVLFCPAVGTKAYMVGVNKEIVHVWKNLVQGNSFSVHLLDNGNILRPTTKVQDSKFGGALSDAIQEIDSAGKVVWEFNYKTDSLGLHHNICLMPNGHIIAAAYEKKTIQEAKDSGVTNLPSTSGFGTSKDPGLLVERLIEIDPKRPKGDEIVWMWRIWNHLVRPDNAAANPQLFSTDLGVDTNWVLNDWVHLNGFDYTAKLDQIVFSSRLFSEVFIIDHGTTTAEAAMHTGGKAGKGGDILYRWGRPGNYKTNGEVFLNVVHCPGFVPEGFPGAGNITMFSNQYREPNSMVIEITTPVKADGTYDMVPGTACGPAKPAWTYDPQGDFKSDYMSSCQRLPNGNTLTCEGATGRLREVDHAGATVWEYVQPTSMMVARARKYPDNHPGIAMLLGLGSSATSPRKTSRTTRVWYTSGRIGINGECGLQVELYSIQGRKVVSAESTRDDFSLDVSGLAAGTYMVKVSSFDRVIAQKRISLPE